MIYQNIKSAQFISRPNRFIAIVELDGRQEVCHVKNTGRCKELLNPGVTVFVQESDNPSRKTKYDLIGVMKGNRPVNIDSQVPNKIFSELISEGKLFSNVILVKPEVKYGNSRFDFYIETEEDKIFVEVKGVTLEENNVALFPDAPTDRGVKHIKELIECAEKGYKAYIVFIIQMKGVSSFTPNAVRHKEFAEALSLAAHNNVNVLAFDCNVGQDFIEINEKVEVKLYDF